MKRASAKAAAWGVFGFAVAVACTPAQREAARELAPAAIRAGCVLLRALADDDTPREVCATAEDLLPLLEEILSEREERARVRAALLGREPVEAAPRVAFAFPELPPKVRAPRRRCIAWAEPKKRDAGAEATKDAGAEEEGGTDGGR